SDLVPPRYLKQGIALNSMQFNMSRVIGPAIGGFSVGIFGIAGSYYLNALSYVAVIIPLLLMRPPQRQRANGNASKSIWQGLAEGLKYARHHRSLQMALLLQLIIAFCIFPYVTLLPIFAGNIFHIGPQGLGELNAAAGIGALVGSILVVLLSQRMQHGSGPLKVLCIVGGSACIAFALASRLELALMILIVLGANASSTRDAGSRPEHLGHDHFWACALWQPLRRLDRPKHRSPSDLADRWRSLCYLCPADRCHTVADPNKNHLCVREAG